MADKKDEKVKDLKDIGAAVAESKVKVEAAVAVEQESGASEAGATEVPAKKEPKIDDLGRSYATGRRKDAVARVWIKPGSGKVVVNGREQTIYFSRQTHRLILNQPFRPTDPGSISSPPGLTGMSRWVTRTSGMWTAPLMAGGLQKIWESL